MSTLLNLKLKTKYTVYITSAILIFSNIIKPYNSFTVKH